MPHRAGTDASRDAHLDAPIAVAADTEVALGPSGDAGPDAWTCPLCEYANDDTKKLCERCGVARRWVRDPTVDLPPRPVWSALPAFWLAWLHGALAIGGLVLLLRPETAAWLAWHPWAQGIQVALAGGACWMSVQKAVTQRLFHQVSMRLPERVRTGETLKVEAEVLAYEPVPRAHVVIELAENTYERRERRDPRIPTFGAKRHQPPVSMRSKRLGRHQLLSGGRLRGRRPERYEARFEAPFPNDATRDVQADLLASAYDALAWLVPGLGEAAENLRNHGGIWARLKVRVGPFTRTVERRVVVWAGAGDAFRIG